MQNRNVRLFIGIAVGLVGLIFVITIVFSRVWPDSEVWYLQNMIWLIPLVIAVFITPVVTLILSNWDIRFSFKYTEDKLIATLSNHGTTPYGFNRIQFASGRKFLVFGKRHLYPESGICDDVDVEVFGSDTSSKLRGHTGCTLRKGLPIALTIRNHKAQENLRNFKENERICLSLYWEGTKQRVYSQRIQPEIVMKIIQNSKQG